MKIGVLSDTHVKKGGTLPAVIWREFADVELILHAGDIVSPHIIEELNCLAPVHAVRGNCDGWDLAYLPDQKIVGLGNIKIGLTHGYIGSGDTPERAFKAFANDPVRIIVFGHSHEPYLQWIDNKLLFNPGSPTNKRKQPQFSFGIITIENDEIQARHIYF